jgi:putative ABC transport system permease protein
VMAPKGQIFGVDFDDCVYIPVAGAMGLFNREGLMENTVVIAAFRRP